MAWGILNTHTGSWGTPELGITEWLQKTFAPSTPTTPQGGSSLSSYGMISPSPSNYGPVRPTYTPTSGSVLGTTAPTNTTTSTGSTGTTTNTNVGDIPTGGGQPSGTSPEELYAQWLDQQYNAQNDLINQQESGLAGQRSGLEQIAQNTYQQGANTLGTQYNTNKGDLEGYQTRTLNDIGDALQSSFRQGAITLGGRGAQDSSAANMMAYSLGKVASKQRGDVMQDVSRRLTNLKTTYDTNLQNLELEKNNQVQQIGQWYADALNSIRGMRAELQQQKSEQALNVAMQMLNDAKAQTAQRQSILDQWAAQKAQSLPELRAMLAANAANLQPFQGLTSGATFAGTSQSPGLFGFGNTQSNDSLNWLQSLFSR